MFQQLRFCLLKICMTAVTKMTANNFSITLNFIPRNSNQIRDASYTNVLEGLPFISGTLKLSKIQRLTVDLKFIFRRTQ